MQQERAEKKYAIEGSEELEREWKSPFSELAYCGVLVYRASLTFGTGKL